MKLLYNKNFNKKEFRKLLEGGDLNGLKYLYENEIKFYKIDNFKFSREEYIKTLYEATIKLNYCVFLYESTDVENHFNWDIYAIVRDKLLEELNLF